MSTTCKRLGPALALAVAALALPATASAALVGYWTFDSAATPWDDLSGNGYGLSPQNGAARTTATSALGGASVQLSAGSQQYLQLPDTSSDFTNAATLSVWLKLANHTPTSSARSGLEGLGTGNTSQSSHYPYTNGLAYFNTFRNTSRVDVVELPEVADRTQWHHLAITTEPGADGYKIYQAGKLIHQTGPGAFYVSPTATLGKSINNHWFDGYMDDATIFNEALFENQIMHLAYGGDPTNLPPANRYEIAGDNLVGTQQFDGTQQNDDRGPLTGAKTITLVQNMNEHLHFAEVKAWETGTGINVALYPNGDASASSSGWGSEPGDANDGDTNGDFWDGSVWHATDTAGAWLTITLDTTANLDSVELWGRTDCCHNRHNDFNMIIRDASNNVLYDEQILGLGGEPGVHRDIPVDMLVSADLVATLNGAGTYVFEIQDGTTADQLLVPNPDPGIYTTILDANDATLEVELLPGAVPRPGDVWTLLSVDAFQGAFDQIILPNNQIWDTSNLLLDGTLRFVAVPEPATLVIWSLLAGLGCGAAWRRRKNARDWG